MSPIITPADLVSPEAFDFTATEWHVLRDLAGEVAFLADRPVEAEKRSLWRQHNALQSTRPLVFCDPEVGWGEIIRQDQLRCEGSLSRRVEFSLRQSIFWGRQMLDDRPIEPFLSQPLFHSIPFWGLEERKQGGEDGGSYTWESPVKSETDIARLHQPVIQVDFASTTKLIALLNAIFGDLLPVRVKNAWWWTLGLTDILARLRGLKQIMLDMVEFPQMVHRLMSLLRDGTLTMLDELESQSLLSPNFDATYVGSGGFGLVNELPRPDCQGQIRTCDLWGFAESQETVGISRRMFEEFVFPYQLPILDRFGLNCYGCCEPLEERWNAVKEFPRLRRVSVAPKADRARMASYLEDRYVYSMKPNPVDLAMETFDEERIRLEIRADLQATRGCRVEVIMKDVTTLRNDPQRAVRWVQIVREETERF